MNKGFKITAILMFFTLFGLYAQDTLFIHLKAGGVLKLPTDKVDSLSFSKGENTLEDIDGNTYRTVVIGNQTWMKDNLKVTTYNDGTPIEVIEDAEAWHQVFYNHNPGMSWYDNDSATYSTCYGGLYNRYAVETGKLCPAGWEVPTIADLETLVDYLGGDEVAGGKLKDVCLGVWESPNGGATNESGFTALPGGYRNYLGDFNSLGIGANFHSSTPSATDNAPYINLRYENGEIVWPEFLKSNGYSVRCIKVVD